MLATTKVIAGSIFHNLRRMLPGRASQADRIANDLRWIVNARREDFIGHLEAFLICRCACQKLCKAWSQDRLDAFEAYLRSHAATFKSYVLNTNRLTIEALMAGKESNFPLPGEELAAELKEFAPFIAACEDRIGGYGVEF